MNVYITSAYPVGPDSPDNIASAWLKAGASRDPFGVHSVCDDPEEADIILFMEGHPGDDLFFERVIAHPLRRRYRNKTFLYHDQDFVFPLMPGLYPSIVRRYYDPALCRAGVYTARTTATKNHAIGYRPDQNTADLLFSFVGDINSKAREDILQLRHPRAHLESTTGRHAWTLSPPQREAYERRFVGICRRSEFILCPRGIGPSSYRLYEAMEMGRCPVILSDAWVPPPHINWEECSLRVQENDWRRLPEILEAHSGVVAAEKGRAARAAWEGYVSQSVCFHWMVESCVALMPPHRRSLSRDGAQYLKFVRCEYFPLYLRFKAHAMRRRLREWRGGSRMPDKTNHA